MFPDNRPLDIYNQTILDKLKLLGENPNPDTIDQIFGNTIWTETQCDECLQKNIPVFQIGNNIDCRETATADICLQCCLDITNELSLYESIK